MSRRSAYIAGFIGVALAMIAAVYLPRCLPERDPEYAADLRACLNPCGEYAGGPIEKSNQEARIELQLHAITVPMGSSSLKDGESRGVVSNMFSFFSAVAGARQAHVMQGPLQAYNSGRAFAFPANLARDGFTELGLKWTGTPTLCKDGKIHLAIEAWWLSEKYRHHAKGAFLLDDCQTSYMGGMRIKTRNYISVPILCELPLIGEAFQDVEGREIDADLIFLATPKIVP